MRELIIYQPSDVDTIQEPARLVKVPGVLYQVMWDTALKNKYTSQNNPLHEEAMLKWRQKQILRLLTEWVEENYPEYAIVNFIDLNDQEADELTEKLKQENRNIRFRWGMYVLLAKGATTNFNVDIQQLLVQQVT